MCGRYTQTASLEELIERFKIQEFPQSLTPRYNIAPGQEAPVVVGQDSRGFDCAHHWARKLELMRWGLIPSWAKEMSDGFDKLTTEGIINARAETLNEKPSFRECLRQRRCLVLADGFYEWRLIEGTRRKIPVRFVLKNRDPFAFAGLWDTWKKSDAGEIRSFTIITTGPNDLMRSVHNRMPVILRRQDEDEWLHQDSKDMPKLISLLGPYPSDKMASYDVSFAVNSPSHDEPDCVIPVAQ